MPIDASIPLSVRAPQMDLMGQYARLLGLQQQQQASAALAEQRQALTDQRRQQTDVAAREQREGDALRALFGGQQPPTPAQIFSIVGPERGKAIVDGLDALTDRGMKRYTDGREALAKVVSGLKALPEPVRAETYQAAVDEFAGRGWLDKAQIPPYGPGVLEQFERELMTPEQRAKVDHPAPVEVSPGASIVDPRTQAVLMTAPDKPTAPRKPERVETVENGRPVVKWVMPKEGDTFPQYVKPERPADDGRLVQVMGPNGQPIWVREADAVGKPAAQAPRAVTGQERQTLSYFNRAKRAADDIAPIEEQIAGMGLASQTRMEWAPNFLQSQVGQSYRQAQRAFTEARLRKESGAAIPTAEYDNDAKTYFAQPGDTPQTLEQKREARQTVLDGLKFSAGKAYEEFYGEAPTRDAKPAPTDRKPTHRFNPATGKVEPVN